MAQAHGAKGAKDLLESCFGTAEAPHLLTLDDVRFPAAVAAIAAGY